MGLPNMRGRAARGPGHSLSSASHGLTAQNARQFTDFTFDSIDINSGKPDDRRLQYACDDVVLDVQNGLDACQPSGSMMESEHSRRAASAGADLCRLCCGRADVKARRIRGWITVQPYACIAVVIGHPSVAVLIEL